MVSVVTGPREAALLDPRDGRAPWLHAPPSEDRRIELERVPQPTPAPRQTRSEIQRRRRRRSRWALLPWLLAAATFALRMLTAATGPTDWDSAQYASAVRHFDVAHGLPQPPGYWLYVEAGRAVHVVTGLGIVTSLVVVAAVASSVAVGLTTVAGRDIGGTWVGLVAGVAVALSPFAWFSGSIVATYSFDMVACALLVILAWRARPGSWHGVAAVGSLALLAGFRQSVVLSFGLLALVAVAGSTRRWGRLGLTVLAGVGGAALWFVPMVVAQPGGFAAWLHATRAESSGAAAATSVLDHAAGAATNLGTFGAYTALALAPLAVVAVLALVVLGIRRGISAMRRRHHPDAERRAFGLDRSVALPGPGSTASTTTATGVPAAPVRPWYQSAVVVLGAAIVPPVLVVSLVQFAKSGYVLAYFPAAVIALLLPLGALTRRTADRSRSSVPWLVVATVAVGAVVAIGAQRFVSADAVIPTSWTTGSPALWIDQPRYQAPYATTAPAIRTTDAMDAAIGDLAPEVRPDVDVVVFDTLDGGTAYYRNAGWELPGDRVALVGPNQVLYNQLDGSLYSTPPDTIAVGPGGSVLLVASPSLPGLAQLTAGIDAVPVTTPDIGGYRVWRVRSGVSILGVPVVVRTGPRPLGSGT
jgi:hypothetical protein